MGKGCGRFFVGWTFVFGSDEWRNRYVVFDGLDCVGHRVFSICG